MGFDARSAYGLYSPSGGLEDDLAARGFAHDNAVHQDEIPFARGGHAAERTPPLSPYVNFRLRRPAAGKAQSLQRAAQAWRTDAGMRGPGEAGTLGLHQRNARRGPAGYHAAEDESRAGGLGARGKQYGGAVLLQQPDAGRRQQARAFHSRQAAVVQRRAGHGAGQHEPRAGESAHYFSGPAAVKDFRPVEKNPDHFFMDSR